MQKAFLTHDEQSKSDKAAWQQLCLKPSRGHKGRKCSKSRCSKSEKVSKKKGFEENTFGIWGDLRHTKRLLAYIEHWSGTESIS